MLARSHRLRTHALAAAAAVAVIAIITGVGIAFAGGSSSSSTTTSAAGPDRQTAPAGYRLISSLGVQIAVPDGWKINDVPTCGRVDTVGTVVRGSNASAGCGLKAPLTKDYAEIGGQYADEGFGPLPTAASTSRVRIDGVPAVRSTAASGDYHYGWIVIESRTVNVYVRTHDEGVLNTILGSVHLVTTDFLDCPVQQPTKRPSAPPDNRFVDTAPRSIAICSYLADGSDRRLNASALLTDSAATHLATAINVEPPGPDPSLSPDRCSYADFPVRTDILLVVTSRSGTREQISASVEACAGGRLDNGRVIRHFSEHVAIEIMNAAGISGGLPA